MIWGAIGVNALAPTHPTPLRLSALSSASGKEGGENFKSRNLLIK
jgi:hypothetical protein